MAIAVLVFAFVFVAAKIWFDERREKRWFKLLDDLLNRKMAGDFFNYTEGKRVIMETKGKNHDPRQLMLDQIDKEIRARGEEKERSQNPPFINQPKAGGVPDFTKRG